MLILLDEISEAETAEPFPEPQAALPELAESELRRNWEELLEPYKRFLQGLWNPRQQPTLGNGTLCPVCGIRRRTSYGYCDECWQKKKHDYWIRKKARMRAQDAANGITRRPWQRIEANETTNNTFFTEHNDVIQENAHAWALHIARYTRDYSAVADYRQELLVFLWKESLYYNPADYPNPKMFVIQKVKNAVSALWRKLNAKKRIFWGNVLHLEDFKKPTRKNGSWEDFVTGIEWGEV